MQQLLRVKPEHQPMRMTGGRVRLGWVHGLASEVIDPTGAVWTLLTAMDGHRTLPEVIRRVLEMHPDQKEADVADILAAFIEAGFVEDVALPPPPGLKPRDLERHDRSKRFYRWVDRRPQIGPWQSQVRLASSRVAVVGVGGSGSSATMALAAAGVGCLVCIDGDRVELSNLNRQLLFTEADIGRLKVDAARERLLALNAQVRVEIRSEFVRSQADLEVLAADCDVLLMCADGPSGIKQWTNRACLRTRTPWVDSGYQGPAATVTSFMPDGGPCFECVTRSQDEGADLNAVLERAPLPLSPAIAPVAGITGHLAAFEAIAILTGVIPVVSARLLTVNLLEPGQPVATDYPKHPSCPACASAVPLTADRGTG